MALSVNNNLASLAAVINLDKNEAALTKSLVKLSSGLRIVSAGDDAAGLALSERFRAQIRGFSAAARSAQDGISMTQVAEGSLGSMGDILSRLRELAVAAGNGVLGSIERGFLNTEYRDLRSELNRIVTTTEFAGLKLITGAQSSGITFQVGIGGTANDRFVVSIVNAHACFLGSTAAAGGTGTSSILTVTNAQSALTILDEAISDVAARRAELGAKQSRLNIVISNLNVTRENVQAAESRIRDLDVADETTKLARNQILVQAATAMLAQANAVPGIALALLGAGG
jgi:flagellin